MNADRHKTRLYIISGCFIIIFFILLWRMYDLTIFNRQFLQEQGDARSVRVIETPGFRGMIMDRQGEPLAVSAPVKSLWVNPKVFSADNVELNVLSDLLQIPVQNLVKRIKDFNNREFIYLKRQLSPEIADKIKQLNIKGLHFQEEHKRYYPESESTAQLIGFTDIDDNGIEGLEHLYNSWLLGESGKKRVVKDRQGNVVEEIDIVKPPRQGNDLRLSIDRRIQYYAYKELHETIDKFAAKSGSVIVLDSENGEILAMANAPSFNPHTRDKYSYENYRNKSLTDLFEPGSVLKPFSIASVLEEGIYNKNSIIDTSPGWMKVEGRVIRDINNFGKLDVCQILQHSSNVGVSKMVLANKPEKLLDILMNAGFGQRTELSYPGEAMGSLVNAFDANPFVHATVAFGYGISVNALQLAKSYLIFANKGFLKPVSLINGVKSSELSQIISTKTANEVLLMMESVLETTHKEAKVAGFRVAGKTGTARIAGKNGYQNNKHIASFVGIAPVSKPKLIVVVVIHEPSKNGYYAGSVAAPLFAKIMTNALHILEIQPDEQINMVKNA